MDGTTFGQLVDIVQLIIVIVAMILIYRSFPANKVDQLIAKIEPITKETDTQADDLMLQMAKILNDLRMFKPQPEVEIPSPDKSS